MSKAYTIVGFGKTNIRKTFLPAEILTVCVIDPPQAWHMKTVASLDFDRHVLLELVLLPIKFKTAEIVSEKHIAAAGNRKKKQSFRRK